MASLSILNHENGLRMITPTKPDQIKKEQNSLSMSTNPPSGHPHTVLKGKPTRAGIRKDPDE